MSRIAYHKTAITGGGADSLDSINGAALLNNDPAIVMAGGICYEYILNSTLNAAEASPFYIRPDSNAGTKVWVLQTQPAESLLSITNVSLAANADTTIYTVPTGRRLVLTKAIIIVGADAGTTVISIGADGAETNWLPNNTLSALDAANDVGVLMPVPNATTVLGKSYAAATVIQAKVSSQAGGATNAVHLFGYLY